MGQDCELSTEIKFLLGALSPPTLSELLWLSTRVVVKTIYQYSTFPSTLMMSALDNTENAGDRRAPTWDTQEGPRGLGQHTRGHTQQYPGEELNLKETYGQFLRLL